MIGAIICGAQKAGTTSLSYYLRQHPELEVSREELHFFDNEKINWESPNYKDCENKFRTPNKIKIDHTPIYMFLNPCCARIHRYNPDMKIIAILRNLTDRSYSQWAMEYNRGRETLSFAQALQRKINATAYSNNKQHRVHSYIKRGMYSNQIKRLWNYFGKENVFVARHEDLKEKSKK